MHNLLSSWFIACVLLTMASSANAWTVNSDEFLYNGADSNDIIGVKSWNQNVFVNPNGLMAVNLDGSADPLAPGTCPVVTNCSGSNCWYSIIEETDPLNQTGLSLPVYYTPKCPESIWKGFTYFGVSPGSGFAMRSWAGKKPIDNSPAFWMPRKSAPNIHIMGIYTTILPPWLMHPWAAECSGEGCDDRVRVSIATDHEVKSMNTPAGTQVQQNTRVVINQRLCQYTPEMPCQYELNFRALCGGNNCTPVEPIIVASDPAQGNIPAVYGSNGGPNTVGIEPSTGFAIWISQGSATQNYPFDKTTFNMTLTWNHHLNILKSIAIKRYGSSSPENIASLFGEGWNDKTNWVLINAGFGQEVYDQNLSDRTYVGGNVQRLSVTTVVAPGC